MPKKKYRPPKPPKIEYVHSKDAKDVLDKAVAKFGTLRQVALHIGCCVAHVYRLNDQSCRTSRSWYEKLQQSLYSSVQSHVVRKTKSKVCEETKAKKVKKAKTVGTGRMGKTAVRCK